MNKDIKILQVLMNSDGPRFVEFFSKVDNRSYIMNAKRFCDTFGFTRDELIAIDEQQQGDR